MGYLITFAVALIGALLAMAVVGLFLPKTHVATGSAEFTASAEELFSAAVTLQEKSDVKTRVIEEIAPNRRVTEVIEGPGAAFGGTWTLEFASEGSKTRLTITERGHVYNPLFRFLARFTFGHRATIDSFLKTLQKDLKG